MILKSKNIPSPYRLAILDVPVSQRKQSHPLGLFYSFSSQFDKNLHAFLCDYHIVGNNPIMEMIFLFFISEHINKSPQHQPVKILFSFNQQLDYWSYSEIDNPLFFQNLSELFKEKVKNIYEVINLVIRRIPHDKLHVYYHEKPLYPSYYRHDSFLNETMISFYPHLERSSHEANEVSEVILLDNHVRDNIRNKIQKYVNSLGFSHEIKNNFENAQLNVFSPHTVLTSLPQGWLENKPFHHHNLLEFEMCFANSFTEKGLAVASASHLSSNIKEAQMIAHQDLFHAKKIITHLLQTTKNV